MSTKELRGNQPKGEKNETKYWRQHKKHRRSINLTQEQLAEKLGVSFQAISRWENGTTYPDMELLPAIAKFFNISVDRLIGCSEDEQELKAEQAFHDLAVSTYEDPYDKEKIIAIIRDIRRNHLNSNLMWKFWLNTKLWVFRDPDILLEVRLTTETLLEKSTDQGAREMVIQHMAKIEDDEHIDAFIKKILIRSRHFGLIAVTRSIYA